MRCLALADVLRERGVQCHFISRAHPGNLIEMVRQHGHDAHALAIYEDQEVALGELPCQHASWLGTDWSTDALETLAVLSDLSIDWLIVDHYALDTRWECLLRPVTSRLMVIDDLADRPHDCALLLDQNLGRNPEDYSDLVPKDCKILTGPKYALLRPEFAALRDYSLARRVNPELKRLLLTMGGVDKDNVTGRVLDALQNCSLPKDCQITVVMGPHAPWLEAVRAKAEKMPWPTAVRSDVRDMAQLMADSDLAIGAAGTSAWERCCLGLPTLTLVLAANQEEGAKALQTNGATQLLDCNLPISKELQEKLPIMLEPVNLAAIQRTCRSITDGAGAIEIAEELISAAI